MSKENEDEITAVGLKKQVRKDVYNKYYNDREKLHEDLEKVTIRIEKNKESGSD